MATDSKATQNYAASYGITEEQISSILQCIKDKNFSSIDEKIKNMHPADIAELIVSLDNDDRIIFIDQLKHRINPDVFTYLEDSIKEEVLEQMGTVGVAAALTDMDSDDAVNILEELDEEQQSEILKSIPASERAILEAALAYPEDSAGRLMQSNTVYVPAFWSVQETMDYIKESQDLPDIFYDIFIVDSKHRPVGVVSLDKILRQQPTLLMSDIMQTDIKTIPVSMDQEEVARLFRKYALVSSPVIDQQSKIIGMITVDDVVDVIDEEAEEDILNLAGVGDSDFYASSFKIAYWRIRWLAVTLINTLIAAEVISLFGKAIHEHVALAYLMVITAAMGGSAGMQSVTVVVRALTTKDIKPGNYLRSIGKETVVSCISGILLAPILGVIIAYWIGDIMLGLILAIAMFINMLWAGFAGTFLPIFIRKLGLDPAISAGPILSTLTDVVGYAIFLGLATIILL